MTQKSRTTLKQDASDKIIQKPGLLNFIKDFIDSAWNKIDDTGGGGGDPPASQTEVNTGTITNKYVSPGTFSGASKWGTKSDTSHNHAGVYEPVSTGKHLSTEDYTTAEKSKLTGIAAGATVGADWNANLSNIPATFPPAAHNQDASTVNAGTLDGDRLPAISATKKGGVPLTGTPSGKYLKDDNTWSTVSALLPEAIIGKLSPTNDVVITAGYYFIIPEEMEIALNHEIEIGIGSVFAII